ncbi:lymphocyte antigen 75-like [Poeciliopsis prolifica]|uniref:lymphocyte antigen 75-like n=1 Tax=Poeciliopsis prolifica TaxID=188132 RepID=UPI00241405BA|nr:lymphocyte antigen 75-like [Poeciliopsis prolifica]
MQWSLILLFLMAQCCFIDCQLYEFHYINENKTWTEAQQYCREKHTDLATVTNMTDMERLINISVGYQTEAWIGLYDQTHGTRTGFWSLPGEEFSDDDSNLNPGGTYDCGKQENCGLLVNTSTRGYASCSIQRYFLCYNETNTTHKYHLIEELKTWQEAQSYCREKHTDLMSGMNQLLDGELEEVMKSTHRKPFFGLFRDTWRWSDGSSFSFRNWNNDFNNNQPNSGQCATTVFEDGGRWKNENCDEKKPFICYSDKVILIKENKSWEDALNYCRQNHHDLVTITNMDDQRWIQQKVKNASTPFVWLGLHYTWTLHFWVWVSDEEVSFENWASCPQGNDCDVSGAMETRRGHRWLEKKDSETFNFVCSK